MDNKEKIAREALRHSELHLDHLNQIAAAADSRAMAFTGLAGVLATLLLTFAESAAFPAFCYLGGIGTILGALMTAHSSLPRGFEVPGSHFKLWKEHVDDDDNIVDVLCSQAEVNDNRIKTNETSLSENATQFRQGVTVVLASTLITILIQFIGIAP